MRRLTALITVYGAPAVNQAAREMLLRGVVGVESLELLLKAEGAPEIEPEPLEFKSNSLNRMTGVPDLSRFDALCFENSQKDNENTSTGDPRDDDTRTTGEEPR